MKIKKKYVRFIGFNQNIFYKMFSLGSCADFSKDNMMPDSPFMPSKVMIQQVPTLQSTHMSNNQMPSSLSNPNKMVGQLTSGNPPYTSRNFFQNSPITKQENDVKSYEFVPKRSTPISNGGQNNLITPHPVAIPNKRAPQEDIEYVKNEVKEDFSEEDDEIEYVSPKNPQMIVSNDMNGNWFVPSKWNKYHFDTFFLIFFVICFIGASILSIYIPIGSILEKRFRLFSHCLLILGFLMLIYGLYWRI